MISVVLCQIVTVAISFILPRLYIENFGSGVNGVLSTVKQIFSYLCLLEAGVGLATSQALLKPVATKDREKINGILAATEKHYIKVGCVYGFAVLLIAAVYGFAVDTDLDSFTVIALVLLNGVPSLVTFFIEGKYCILMETDGRQYVINNSQTVLQVVSGLAKVAVLILTDDLLLMQSTYCLIAVLQLLYITAYAKKRYSWLDFGVKPNTAAISQKNSVIVHQISAMVFNNTDILLLSALADFGTASVYYIYNLFFSQVETFISNLVKGFNFALGQLFSVNREEFLKKYRAYETLYVCVNFIVYTAMNTFLLAVIEIYTGGINDAEYINPLLILLFSASKLISCAKLPANQVIEYSGDFKNTKWHAIVEIKLFGICGALAGTVAAIVFRNIVTLIYTNRKIFHRSAAGSFALLFVNGAVFAGIYLIFGTAHFCGMKFLTLCLHGVLNMLWIAPLYIAANALLRPDVFKALINSIKCKISKENVTE